MAFITGDGATQSFPRAFSEVEQLATGVRNHSERVYSKAASGDLTGLDVINYFRDVGQKSNEMGAIVAGMSAAEANAFAQERYNQPSYNVATEFAAMMSAIDDILAWINANVPVSSILTFNNGSRVIDWTTYTPSQTNQFRSKLQDLAATID